MAIAAPAPSTGIGPIKDPVTITEALALFSETGHPVKETNLRRWVKEAGLKSVRRGRTVWYSDSDLLELHARKVFCD